MTFEGQEISKKQYKKRTPGKVKLEFTGVGMVCLNSKVHHIWISDMKFKTLSKGMQERNRIKKEDFLNVLVEKIDHQVTRMPNLSTMVFTKALIHRQKRD